MGATSSWGPHHHGESHFHELPHSSGWRHPHGGHMLMVGHILTETTPYGYSTLMGDHILMGGPILSWGPHPHLGYALLLATSSRGATSSWGPHSHGGHALMWGPFPHGGHIFIRAALPRKHTPIWVTPHEGTLPHLCHSAMGGYTLMERHIFMGATSSFWVTSLWDEIYSWGATPSSGAHPHGDPPPHEGCTGSSIPKCGRFIEAQYSVFHSVEGPVMHRLQYSTKYQNIQYSTTWSVQ